MRPDHPHPALIPGLRKLWQEAFGDTEEYLDGFFRLAYSPENCLCIGEGDIVHAALYWLDMTCRGERIAYIYAVATAKNRRGEGLCRTLMDAAHVLLAQRGYAAAVLVPQNVGLSRMYEKMGYASCCGISKMTFSAAEEPVSLRRVGQSEYNALRNTLLPAGGVELGERALAFLAIHAEFFTGDGFALAAVEDKGVLHGLEYLGDTAKLPGIATALSCREGTARTPGNEKPFAMYCPLRENAPKPSHFGFAFD